MKSSCFVWFELYQSKPHDQTDGLQGSVIHSFRKRRLPSCVLVKWG